MWTLELENMWKSRFKVIADPNQLFHDYIEMCAESEALGDLKLAIAEIGRLRATKDE
jgi:hypothetical protein